jgi:hypothetical protein
VESVSVWYLINKKVKYIIIILIPLSLSAYTHLWNLVGFPSIHIDEAHYLRRTLLVLDGRGPQESATTGYPRTYDHPYFGQLFMAGLLSLVGYPNIVGPQANVNSIETLHLVPRIMMGLLAIFDTFMIFKISERRYNCNIALIAAILFAVMPITWMLRRVFLDNLLLPFLLSSIFLALCVKPKTSDGTHTMREKYLINENIIVLLSGIFLGLAIYTKLPAITIIPLAGGLIFVGSKKNLKVLGLWLVPVFAIPLLWPIYSVAVGQSDLWTQWVIWQTDRDKPLYLSLISFFQMDPIIMIIGFSGIIFARIKRDFFPLGWILPFLLFSFFIGFVQYFHLIFIFPPLCIASAILIDYLQKKIATKYAHKLTSVAIPGVVIIFGIVTTTMLITTDVNSDYYKVYASIAQDLPTTSNNKPPAVTLIGSHWWVWDTYWISQAIMNKTYYLIDPMFDRKLDQPLKTEKVIFVGDSNFKDVLSKDINSRNFQTISRLFNSSHTLANFTDNVTSKNNGKYPYTILSNMIENENRPLGKIQIRSNH